MLSYPAELPLPLQAQYSESVQPNIKRSSMSDGYVRQRKITSNALHSLSVSWYFTAEQLVIFQEFFSRINEGADWFLMKVPSQKYVAGQTSFDVIERSVRFQSGKYTSTLQFFSDERWLWKITAALDLNLNDFLEAETEDDSWNYDSEYEFKNDTDYCICCDHCLYICHRRQLGRHHRKCWDHPAECRRYQDIYRNRGVHDRNTA